MGNDFSSSLYIEAYDDNNERCRSGSGTLIRFLDDKGQECHLIVTCLHVINLSEDSLQLSQDIRVWRPGNAFIPDKIHKKAEVIAHGASAKSDGEDLALLKIVVGDLELSGISDFLFSEHITERLALDFYGYPLGRKRIEKLGYVVGCKHYQTKISGRPGDSIYLVDCPLTAGGVSGGAVLCRDSHELVGIWRGKWLVHSLVNSYTLFEPNLDS